MRGGTRYNHRGIDERIIYYLLHSDGAAANTVETE